MPQIWMTYDELAVLMDCDKAAARAAAITIPLDRRKSRDGQTRAKLTPSLTEAFLDRLLRHRLEDELKACVRDLCAIRERMRAPVLPALGAATAG